MMIYIFIIIISMSLTSIFRSHWVLLKRNEYRAKRHQNLPDLPFQAFINEYGEDNVMGTFDYMVHKFWCWNMEKLVKDPVRYSEVMTGHKLEDVRVKV